MLETRDAFYGDVILRCKTMMGSTLRTKRLLLVIEPSHSVKIWVVTELPLTTAASEVPPVPSPLANLQTFVIDGLLACGTEVRLLVGELVDARRIVGRCGSGRSGIEVSEIIEEYA